MERADFVHMVRSSEQASAEDSRAYRRSVAAFAALGYAWVVGCVLLSLGVIWWGVHVLRQGRYAGWLFWLLLVALGLLWASARALWFRLEAPQGLRITAADAPKLFEAIERLRKRVKGPPVHEVLLDGELNASIGQRPRWGLFGGARNHLTIGLPLLLALDRQRFLAVLAHEYGHLRGEHGRFSAWIYRTRLSWARLDQSLSDSGNVANLATQAFLRWYFPRFVAKTFAMARQDEYEADRIAGRLMGAEAAGAGLVEVTVKGLWLDREFWRAHWAQAATEPLPVGPYGTLRKLLALPPDPSFARRALREALARLSDLDDTHPSLRDRLEALQCPAALRSSWSQRPAIELLGGKATEWLAHFDAQWRKEQASAWKAHHANLQRVRARVESLAQRLATCSADELVELAGHERRLDPRAAVASRFEMALRASPDHPGTLRGTIEDLPDAELSRKLELLQRLHDARPDWRWWAALTAVGELESDGQADLVALRAWRGRLKEAETVEERASEEMHGADPLAATSAHDLNPYDADELKRELADWPAVARAWLLRKTLRELPQRRAYLLCLELPGLQDEDRWHLCRALEREVSLPGPVLAVWTGAAARLRDVQARGGAAVYAR